MNRCYVCLLLFLLNGCCSMKITNDLTDNVENEMGMIKVLIVDGFSNHDWKATTQMISSVLKEDAVFDVEVSTVPDQQSAEWETWLPSFGDYDVVIQNTNDISKKGAWPKNAQVALEQFMSTGGGLYIFHSANNSFPKWLEYNEMIGLGWRGKNFGSAIIVENEKVKNVSVGEGENTGHGKRVDALITRLGDHPIHRGLPKRWVAADLEIYRYSRGPAKNLDVLSYAEDEKTGLNFPIEWVVNYREGRVYNSTYGHYWHDLEEDPEGVRCVAFQTIMKRAVRWLAKFEIDEIVPSNFPSEESPSLHRPSHYGDH